MKFYEDIGYSDNYISMLTDNYNRKLITTQFHSIILVTPLRIHHLQRIRHAITW